MLQLAYISATTVLNGLEFEISFILISITIDINAQYLVIKRVIILSIYLHTKMYIQNLLVNNKTNTSVFCSFLFSKDEKIHNKHTVKPSPATIREK